MFRQVFHRARLAFRAPVQRSFASSAPIVLKVPVLNFVEDLRLLSLLKAPGDSVQTDELVAVLETDCIDIQIRAPTSGTFAGSFANEGDDVPVGADLCKIEPDLETAPLSEREVLEFHDALLLEFGGLPGILSRPALESALAQPFAGAFGTDFFQGPFQKAAAYAYFIGNNHPFSDCNKRTSLYVALEFLFRCGYLLDREQPHLASVMPDVVSGKMTRPQLAEIFKDVVVPMTDPDIRDAKSTLALMLNPYIMQYCSGVFKGLADK
eukprot:TRINITY_DN2076_c0_g1_i1.p1 TRINITY_DN2076_c0_g1~~TRINITY_DN2076_c0_g1_i1.p1  ORF type:complete len:266 (-),score=70.16 TRINITY_DN2076_c0_g1_i1:48-845(-)